MRSCSQCLVRVPCISQDITSGQAAGAVQETMNQNLMERTLESLIQIETMMRVRTVTNLTSLMMVTMKYLRTMMFLNLWMMVMYAPPLIATRQPLKNMLVRLNDCDAQRRSTKLIAPTTRLKILHASQPPGTISVQYLIVAVKMKTCQLTKLMHASKVKRLQRLKKKHQVDSTEDEIEDSSCKPTTRHNFRSIFDSCSEDEDFLAKEEDLPANKTNASEEHADKVKRGRRLNKKHQVDSIDEKIEDSSCKPAFRRKPCSIFDSGSEDEDFLAKEKVLPSLSEKTNGKVSKENKPENVASKEETKKKSRNDRKRKSDTIDQDPASPMDETEVNGSSVPKQEAELKKKSKKKKRTASEADDGKHSNNIRTLENGLVIEDLSAGNQDAKVASNGSKVYINYVGKLQNGKTVHPNAKEKPYKFKLGSEKVIPGWNLGIDGMHVGDKRRLTVPPALCENGGKLFEQVPKNKTIFYEVELVKVK
nr:FK506-binding protein 4-like isoform X4 [Lolium perenne]